MIKKHIKNTAIVFAFFLSFLAFFSAQWYVNIFGTIGFKAIIFTLLSPMEGTASGIVYDWLLKGLLPTAICTVLLCLFYFLRFNLKVTLKKAVCIIVCLCLWAHGIVVTEIPLLISGMITKTQIYDTEYRSPKLQKITFPKQKQNLIYIYLESMETTYLSFEEGGGLKENVIPELYNLAKNNINFSHSSDVGGWEFVTNTSWTSAAIVAQTAGVPLTLPLFNTVPKKDTNLLPGIITLNDILHQNGYTQTVMFGSKASYGGKENYFKQHSVDKILDYNTAITDGIIDKDYFVWWGMEDHKLIEYAKRELTALSKGDKPFNFTMLTADTHHISGYKCDLCEDNFDSQYENVLHCSSKQISEFVDWIKAQPFYKNTTIVLIGDHHSMDQQFFTNNIDSNYTRRVYNCFINSRVTAKNTKNRSFTPMDIFPTTLAALGCEIEEDQLGLGTNLFGGNNTLTEEMSVKKLNSELNKGSKFYKQNFIEK